MVSWGTTLAAFYPEVIEQTMKRGVFPQCLSKKPFPGEGRGPVAQIAVIEAQRTTTNRPLLGPGLRRGSALKENRREASDARGIWHASTKLGMRRQTLPITPGKR